MAAFMGDSSSGTCTYPGTWNPGTWNSNASDTVLKLVTYDNGTYTSSDAQVYLNPQTFTPYYLSSTGSAYERTIDIEWQTNNLASRGDITCPAWYAPAGYTVSDSFIYNTSSNSWSDVYPVKSAKERMREALRSRLAGPAIITRKFIRTPDDIRETRARDALRRILGEEKYRNFLKNGFVTARNPRSGYVYQIFHERNRFVRVFKDGKCVERLCIHLQHGFTPTDFVITMYLMALNNDKDIWKTANKQGRSINREPSPANYNSVSLPELFRQFKKVG